MDWTREHWTDARHRITDFLETLSPHLANAYRTIVELTFAPYASSGNPEPLPSRAELVCHLGRDIINGLCTSGGRVEMVELQNLSDAWESQRTHVELASAQAAGIHDRVTVSLHAAQVALELCTAVALSNVKWREKLVQVFKNHLEASDFNNPALAPAVKEFAGLHRGFHQYAHISTKRTPPWDEVRNMVNRLEVVLTVLSPASFFENKEAIDDILTAANG